MKISAIILAAGKGERAGFNKNKLLVPLHGAPVLYHTLKKFQLEEIEEVIVTASKKDFKEISALCKPFGYEIVLGGKTRTDSVKNALNKVTGDIVLIHDGARPFVSRELILNCIESVKLYGSGICAVNATDTAVYSTLGVVSDRLDRSSLYLVQTPQGFYTEDIKNAYSLAGDKSFTDDSAVYGAYIDSPRICAGDSKNIKLTFKDDFEKEYPAPLSCNRTGFGVDVHAFGEGNFVTLAGEKIECANSLIAHSDGDVIIHSVMDAYFSAAGLEDIGHYFPDSDEKFKGADSGRLLKNVVQILREKGFAPESVSISVQAERPRLAPHIDKMKQNLAALLSIDKESIAIAAGTCEGLGFVGEGLGIISYCFATVKKI